MVDREIYELKGEVGGLKASVDTLLKTWQQQDNQATEGRRRLYDKVDELSETVNQLATRAHVDDLENRIIGLSGRVDGLEARVVAVEPRAAEWNNHQQQKIGSNKVLAFVWAAMLAGTSLFGGVVVKLIDIFWPPKGH